MKLLIFPLALLLIAVPSAVDKGATLQTRAEQIVRNFLSSKATTYMALYFSDIDTAFRSVNEEPSFQELSKKVLAYQDSTNIFSHTDVAKADSFYKIYKKLNLEKDSMRIHYQPQPLGYFIIHHFQYNGETWTDSFMFDFNLRSILKIKEAIE